MQVEKKIHSLWRKDRENVVGKFHYFYSTKRGKISLVKVLSCGEKMIWEICGGGITDIQRFDSKKDAERTIKEMLSDLCLSCGERNKEPNQIVCNICHRRTA